MPDFDKVAEGKEIQVALLSRALFELRRAHEHPQALREAAIRYFKSGIAQGFEIGPLLEWFFLWPSGRWSVFAQTGFSGSAGHEFLEMVKKLTIQDLDSNDRSKAS